MSTLDLDAYFAALDNGGVKAATKTRLDRREAAVKHVATHKAPKVQPRGITAKSQREIVANQRTVTVTHFVPVVLSDAERHDRVKSALKSGLDRLPRALDFGMVFDVRRSW